MTGKGWGTGKKKLANLRIVFTMPCMEKNGGFVYIMTNRKDGVLYIGSTSDLVGRIYEHKKKMIPKSFTARYNLDKLVYFEWWPKLENMVVRERQLKEWNRDWKIRLIEKMNPDWDDLYNAVLNGNGFAPLDD